MKAASVLNSSVEGRSVKGSVNLGASALQSQNLAAITEHDSDLSDSSEEEELDEDA